MQRTAGGGVYLPLLFMSIRTALTGVRCAGDEVLRLVEQMGLMNQWTRVVVAWSLNVIGSRCTAHTRTHAHRRHNIQSPSEILPLSAALARRRSEISGGIQSRRTTSVIHFDR